PTGVSKPSSSNCKAPRLNPNRQCCAQIHVLEPDQGQEKLHRIDNTFHHTNDTPHHTEKTLDTHHADKTPHHTEKTLDTHHADNTPHHTEKTFDTHHSDNTPHHTNNAPCYIYIEKEA
ncbi:MAG: hypothetical protein AAGJ35_09665, partial [Myxococcota bacterium]